MLKNRGLFNTSPGLIGDPASAAFPFPILHEARGAHPQQQLGGRCGAHKGKTPKPGPPWGLFFGR